MPPNGQSRKQYSVKTLGHKFLNRFKASENLQIRMPLGIDHPILNQVRLLAEYYPSIAVTNFESILIKLLIYYAQEIRKTKHRISTIKICLFLTCTVIL